MEVVSAAGAREVGLGTGTRQTLEMRHRKPSLIAVRALELLRMEREREHGTSEILQETRLKITITLRSSSAQGKT